MSFLLLAAPTTPSCRGKITVARRDVIVQELSSSCKDLILLGNFAVPDHRGSFPLFQMLWLQWVGRAQSFPRGAWGFSRTIFFKVKGRATQLSLGQQLRYVAFHNYNIYWFGEHYEKLFGWAWTFPMKRNNYRLQAGKHWGLQYCSQLCLWVGQTSQSFAV